MASRTGEMVSTPKFGYGQTVRTTPTAPLDLRPREFASVCGMRRVAGLDDRGASAGRWVYTVEFGDGSSVEVPEEYLSAVTSSEP